MSETAITADKLEKMMRQIRSLLERADHPRTPPEEADSARAKAEEFIRKYRIEESALGERGGVFAIMPINRMVPLGDYSSPFFDAYANIAAIIADHCECKYVWKAARSLDGGLNSVFHVFGFESDVRYMEMLFQSARLVFADRMEPKPESYFSEQENVYRMRSAGMERIRISRLMGWGEKTGRVTPLYVAECAKRGEAAPLVGKGLNVKVYREGYANQFMDTLYRRLSDARQAGLVENAYALVLGGRKEAVEEAFWTAYPGRRPQPVSTTVDKPSKPRKVRGPTQADYRRWKQQNSPTALAGRRAGADSARAVNLGRSGTRVEE